MRKAVIGIGSNSVRMLLCEVEGDRGERLLRDRAGTRLFAGLDGERRLSAAAMEKTAAAVKAMAEHAREEKAEEIRLFATSATRDAANAEEFAALLKREAGAQLEIISGEEEAALSYLGATGGGHAGVIDIGGGSTEIVVGRDASIEKAFSCQIGAVRLLNMQGIGDLESLEKAIAIAGDIVREMVTRQGSISRPEKWSGTGGTFTCLASMANGTAWDDRTHTHGTLLEKPAVRALAERLAPLSVEERRRIPSLQPGRADIVVHGICILLACMELMDIGAIRVSEYGNLDGYFLARLGVSLN
ncbi:MAG: hypothetical protein IKP40_01070 [Clostridia bacterium]|nr:hypothetical protein [Clostridia bacterium]